MKKEISSLNDITGLVDSFYEAVREDGLIGPVFNRIIADGWPEHLEKMYSFWQTVLLGGRTYSGSPFPPHAGLSLEQAHFDRWQQLWNLAIDRLFFGYLAQQAKWRGAKMAEMFLSKINYYADRQSKPLI